MALDIDTARIRRKQSKSKAKNPMTACPPLDMLVLPKNAKEPPDFEALLQSLPRFDAAEAQSMRKAIADERVERRRHSRETAD